MSHLLPKPTPPPSSGPTNNEKQKAVAINWLSSGTSSSSALQRYFIRLKTSMEGHDSQNHKPDILIASTRQSSQASATSCRARFRLAIHFTLCKAHVGAMKEKSDKYVNLPSVDGVAVVTADATVVQVLEVVAPADLAEGYQFEVVSNGKRFAVVTVRVACLEHPYSNLVNPHSFSCTTACSPACRWSQSGATLYR
jgi:hypothetical protein